jgi:hypothetical protein
MDIHDIPDYPALEQLANALWKAGKARGAAVLMGAGHHDPYWRHPEAVMAN